MAGKSLCSRRSAFICLLLVALFVSGCTGPASNETGQPLTGDNSGASLNKDDYPAFPDADAGADPSVSADQGGKGFTGQGWETNTSFDLIGDPRAVKGGLLRDTISDFPGTLRMGGPEWNTSTNYMIANMMYETLLGVDPTTTDYVPRLATHWQVSTDKMTYRFRINPNA